MGRSEVSTIAVKWCEGLSNKLSIIIINCTDINIKCNAYNAVPCITLFHFLLVPFLSFYI